MRLARVLGSVVATIKHPSYEGQRIMLCQPLSPAGEKMGSQMIAVDRVDSGPGDLVLVLTEGNGVRQLMGQKDLPIRSLIVGVVDAVVLD
jgi:ethanolamine utilization protein EutN